MAKIDRLVIFIQCQSQSQSQSYITTDSQSASPSGIHLGPATNFSHSLSHFFDSFLFVDVKRPLSRVVWSAQAFSDLSPTGLMSVAYCLYF
jgi:hypothetical protein